LGTGGPLQGQQTGRSVKLIIHLRLVPRLRICGAIPSLIHMTSWRGS